MSEVPLDRDRLAEAHQSKSQFMADLSHELRTPLNAIIGFTRIVIRKTREDLDDRQARNLQIILENGERMLEMVNDLLDIERIEAGLLHVAPSEVDCEALLQEIVECFAGKAASKGLTLQGTNRSGTRLIRIDPVRLRQILDNLVIHGLKHSKRGGIQIEIFKEDGRLCFSVADEGIDINRSEVQRIFEPLQQVDGKSIGAEGGGGLGLHLVRRLVALLGGTIHLDGTDGAGARLTACFDSAAIGLKPRDPVVPTLPPTEGTIQGQDLLVIDDDPDSCLITTEALTEAGYRVHVVQSGQSGLKTARTLKPAAILLDIILPDIDGWTVLREIRKDPALLATPVIIFTVLDETTQGRALGSSAWLMKPVKTQVLLATLAGLGLRPGSPERRP